ncbi:calcium-activated chloride channel regulator 3A-1-like, partial [Homarus americanus]|uniref:calcium-activated chloride channel regulator 3A-1-like n=1 Tax=Homarus americanus TaxID=6706 RepID=UPI001C4973A6
MVVGFLCLNGHLGISRVYQMKLLNIFSRMRLVTVLVVVVVLAARSVVSTSSNVRLINNGYEGVVVAIAPSVDESFAEDIISSIKETLTKASDDLFKATRRRAFFRRIKILLPKSWNNVIFDQTALNENYEDSDIRVDLRNPVYGDQPYTVQPGGCGEPGRYMHLTPQYLTDNTQADLWGPRGKTVLHEWAKLRWGVFDEFGYPHDPTFPLFYWTSEITADGVNTVYTPNYCANQDLKGELRDLVDGGSCSYVNGLPDEDCRFVPDDVQAASSSFMAYYYINNIVEFCDTATDEKFSHNEFAPNRQNMMCNSRSVWDVIYQHQDFTNG